jgi:hypothetical protein
MCGQALENRTLDSKREMDIMNALDELKSMSARQEGVDSDALLAALRRSADEEQVDLDAADEAAVRNSPAACPCRGLLAPLVSICVAVSD